MIELLKNFKFYIILGIVLIFLTLNMSDYGRILELNNFLKRDIGTFGTYQLSKVLGIKLYIWHTLCLMIIGYGYYIKPKK